LITKKTGELRGLIQTDQLVSGAMLRQNIQKQNNFRHSSYCRCL